MSYPSTNSKDLFVLQESECPLCKKAANIRVSEERKRFLPWRATEYHGTCGSCFGRFKLDKDRVKNLTRFTPQEVRGSASRKGKLAATPPEIREGAGLSEQPKQELQKPIEELSVSIHNKLGKGENGVPAGRQDAHVTKKGVTTAFTSANALAIVVAILLGIVIIVDIIAIVSDLAQIDLLGGYYTWSEAEANDNRQSVIGMAQLGVLIVTAIFFLFWIYRAHKNLPALGARNLKYSPGWAVGGWFVPFLNLVRPVQVVTEIWKASDPKVADSDSWRNSSLTPLISAWWALWLIGNFIGWFVVRMTLTGETASELIASTWALLISDAIDIPAAILAILVVWGINNRQEQKYRHLTIA